jgi:uncharacterized membrane protein
MGVHDVTTQNTMSAHENVLSDFHKKMKFLIDLLVGATVTRFVRSGNFVGGVCQWQIQLVLAVIKRKNVEKIYKVDGFVFNKIEEEGVTRKIQHFHLSWSQLI